MINQLKFYEIDETTLGTDTETDEEIVTEEDQRLAKGVDEEEEELQRQRKRKKRLPLKAVATKKKKIYFININITSDHHIF